MTEPINKRYRYPGISSFEAGDGDIFFGREGDLRRLSNLVEGEKTVLLYSRSGLGKSSLIKAALLPDLAAKGYNAFYIRLNLHQKGSLPPVQSVLKRTVLEQNGQVPASFLGKFLNRSNSLWYAFKSAQAAGDERPVVLVFDQFEEVGSYPDEQLAEFKKQLAELLYTAVPAEYSEALDLDLLSGPLTEAETDLLYRPLRVKAVFAIRSDQMSVLNALSDRLPNILKSHMELGALDPAQATEAIRAPAAKPSGAGNFATPPFDFDDGAVQKMLRALGGSKGGIDTAHLQILLRHVERELVEKRGLDRIGAEDLGDLGPVYENYYLDSLMRVPEGEQRENARRLVEDRLIVDGKRISLDIALCLQLAGQEVLDLLVDTRLLRKEPNTLGSFSYELSHDTLVAPVNEAKKQREAEEERLEEERRQAEALREAQEKAEADRIEKERTARQLRVVRALLAVAIVALALAIGGIWYAFDQREIALDKEKEAQANLAKFTEAEVKRLTALASALAANDEYGLAAEQVENALKLDPDNQELKQLRDKYAAQQE